MEPHSPGMVQDDTFTSIGRDIPNVTKLCEELGYEPRRSPLKTEMDRYIYEFTTDRGEKGESFTRRKEPLHEAGIRSLTEKFLDQDGNGPLFWPDHPAFPWSGRLQYSTHRDQIRSAVHKLFWRYIVQNKQNNQKRDNQKQNKKKQKKQEHRVPRDKNAPKPRRRVAAQKGVATHQVQSRENSVGFEQPPHASAVSVPIVPETNESAEIPSPAITPRPASPLFPKYIEESVGDCNIQDARGESHASGELLSQPAVPMAPMTDGLGDGPSRQNETTTAGQSQQKGKNPATHLDLGQDTRPVKRKRHKHNSAVNPHGNSAGAFARNSCANSVAGPSHSPSRSRKPPSRYGDYISFGDDAPQLMDSPVPSGTDDELEHVNLEDTNQGTRAQSRVLTPQHAPEPAPEDAPENTPRAALEGASNHGVDRNSQRPTEEVAENMPLPSVNLNYDIQVSKTKFVSFFPRSPFSELSLQELMNHLPQGGDFSCFTMNLKIGEIEYHHERNIGEEASFRQMKIRFQKRIETARLHSRGQTSLFVEILVVPMS